MKMPLYQAIATTLDARANCARTDNHEWYTKHTERLRTIVREHMPSGAGFDVGTQLDPQASTPEKLVFHTRFHNMDNNGYYTSWDDYRVTVEPSLVFGILIKTRGSSNRDRRDYVTETFEHALQSKVEL